MDCESISRCCVIFVDDDSSSSSSSRDDGRIENRQIMRLVWCQLMMMQGPGSGVLVELNSISIVNGISTCYHSNNNWWCNSLMNQ